MGGAFAAAGTLPWAALVKANMEYMPWLPWAVPVTALYLWLFWRTVRRFEDSRLNRVSEDVWGWAIVAGVLGLGALVSFFSVLNRLMRLPSQSTEGDFTDTPLPTLFTWVVMSAIVAGVTEETSFRGFMQGPIERRHGPVVAIFVTGSFFGFAHFTHPEVTLRLMPFYMSVAIIYGLLAYFTNSVLPSMILHAGGNVLGSLDLFTRGQSEWQASATPAPLVWETGPDAGFWLSCIAAVLTIAAAAWAYIMLARSRRVGLNANSVKGISTVAERQNR